MGAAITAAEKAENQGILKLTRWRAGKTEEWNSNCASWLLHPTAPYDCPKSKLVFEDACKALERNP